MKKLVIFIFTTLCLSGMAWGIVSLVHMGGGFKSNDVNQIKDTGQIRNWTKKDFEVLTPQDWDNNSDSEYKKIVKVFGPGVDRRESKDTLESSKSKVTHLVIAWRQKNADIYMGFYKYSENGKWILHDKTWTDK